MVGTIGVLAGPGGLAERFEGVAIDTWAVLGAVICRIICGAGTGLDLGGSIELARGDTSVTGGWLCGGEAGITATD